MLLGCEAFECGFVERIAWWYSYFEEGLIRDRFWSDPLMPLSSFQDKIWGPDDPRVIYAKCLGVEKLHEVRLLPPQIAGQFQGDLDTLSKILKPQVADLMKNILQEKSPEVAIERLSQVMDLPYIGELETADFLEDFAGIRRRVEPTPDWITQTIKQGLTLIMLHHPKHVLLYGVNKDG